MHKVKEDEEYSSSVYFWNQGGWNKVNFNGSLCAKGIDPDGNLWFRDCKGDHFHFFDKSTMKINMINVPKT